MRALALGLLAVTALVVAPSSAAALPTSTTLMPVGPHDPQGLIAAERVGPHRARFRILQTTDGAVRLALVAGGCANGDPDDAVLRLKSDSGEVIDYAHRLPRGRMAWFVRTKDGVTCIPQARFTAVGAITSPRDSASGLPAGIVSFQRARGALQVLGLFADARGGNRFGPSTTDCAHDPEFEWSIGLQATGDVVAIGVIDAYHPARWKSIVLTGRGDAAAACVKWELGELDAAHSTAAASDAAPTSVTALDDGELLVAAQRVGARRLRLSVLNTSGIRNRIALHAGGCRQATSEALMRVKAPNGKVVETTRTLPAGVLDGRLSFFSLPEVDDEVLVCSKAGRFARVGAVTSPRDSASGQATGVVALQKRGRSARVTALFPSAVTFGASTTPCGGAPAFDWTVQASKNEVSIETLEIAHHASWRSIATDGGACAALVL